MLRIGRGVTCHPRMVLQGLLNDPDIGAVPAAMSRMRRRLTLLSYGSNAVTGVRCSGTVKLTTTELYTQGVDQPFASGRWNSPSWSSAAAVDNFVAARCFPFQQGSKGFNRLPVSA